MAKRNVAMKPVFYGRIGGRMMYRSELLEELIRCKYPFGKAASVVEIATNNGIFENDEVRITIVRENDEECYKCTIEWK